MVLSRKQLTALLLSATATTAAAQSSGEKQMLLPMVPSDFDGSDMSTIAPVSNLTLFFATPIDNSGDLSKRDEPSIFAKVGFGFKMPSISMDQTSFVEDISCSETTMKGRINDITAFKVVRARWPEEKILLITSTPGCGTKDDNNGYFAASEWVFDRPSQMFEATGEFLDPEDTYDTLNLDWSAEGLEDKEPSGDVMKRATFSAGRDFGISPEIAAGMIKGKKYLDAVRDAASEDDPRAPWPRSFPLWSTKAKDLDAGLSVYCVDCGITGRVNIAGTIEASLLPWEFGVKKLQVGFNGNLHAGLFLGVDAHLNYEKRWSQQLVNVPLLGWSILGVVDLGPYIALDIEAAFAVRAKGSLLVGGALDWPDFGATLDAVDQKNTKAWGFQPQTTRKLEAKGELNAEASLGLPLSLGLQAAVRLPGGKKIQAYAALKDKPSLNAVASASMEYINDQTSMTKRSVFGDNSTVSDELAERQSSCYGVNWEIYARNEIKFEAEAPLIGHKDVNIRDDRFSLGKGCLGYTPPKCRGTVIPAPVVPVGLACNSRVSNYNRNVEVGSATTRDRKACALACWKKDECRSFAWNRSSSTCQLLTVPWGQASGVADNNGAIELYDRNCFETRDCMLSTDTAASPYQKRWMGLGDLFSKA